MYISIYSPNFSVTTRMWHEIILNGVELVWIESFTSSILVTLLRLNNPVCSLSLSLYIYIYIYMYIYMYIYLCVCVCVCVCVCMGIMHARARVCVCVCVCVDRDKYIYDVPNTYACILHAKPLFVLYIYIYMYIYWNDRLWWFWQYDKNMWKFG